MSPTNLRNNLNCLAREILRRVFVGGSGGKVKSNNDLFLYHLLLGHRVQEATCGAPYFYMCPFYKDELGFPIPVGVLPSKQMFSRHAFPSH